MISPVTPQFALARTCSSFAVKTVFLVVFGTASTWLPSADNLTTLEENDRQTIMKELGDLTDKQLQQKLSALLRQKRFRNEVAYEPTLLEVVRRGGADFEAFLLGELELLTSRSFKIAETLDDSGDKMTLELVTAIRRIQNEVDPIQVTFNSFDNGTLTPINLPKIDVAIKNIDDRPIALQVGGNYRSGRQTRWRVRLADESGSDVAVKQFLLGIGGGLSSEQLFEPGKNWETQLILDHLVEVQRPGKYMFEVLYHNSQTILHESNLDGLIYCKSKPIEIEIHPINISFDKSDKIEIENLIDQLDPDSLPHILVGEYGQWAADFLDRESSQAKLLILGPKTIPSLVDRMNNSESIEFRAHALAILFSITGRFDPRVDKILGEYKYLVDAWGMENSVQVSQHSGRFNRGSIDSKTQQLYVDRWVKWAQECVVEVKN